MDILHLHCFGQRLVEDVHPKQCKCRMSNYTMAPRQAADQMLMSAVFLCFTYGKEEVKRKMIIDEQVAEEALRHRFDNSTS